MTTYREDLESALAQYNSLLGFWRSRTFEQPSITDTLDERDLIKKNKEEHSAQFNEKFDEFLTYLLETFSSPEQMRQLSNSLVQQKLQKSSIFQGDKNINITELEKLPPAAIPFLFLKNIIRNERAGVSPQKSKMFSKFASLYKSLLFNKTN